MLITDSYRKLNSDLHAGGNYGRHGDKWAERVDQLVQEYHAATVLDYGCGQGSLGRALGEIVREYDPAIPEKSATPSPVDLVVCTDVLEHIEPACLGDVLDHLRDLSRKACFVVIATRPAQKFLADGRNAHLIVETDDYWRKQLGMRFRMVGYEPMAGEFASVLEPLRGWRALIGRVQAKLSAERIPPSASRHAARA